MEQSIDSSYYLSFSGVVVPIIYYAVRRYLNQRKEESNKLQQLDRDNAVKEAEQDLKIENILERLNKLENG